MARSMRTHKNWNLGVRIGKTTHKVRVRTR
jgi:hypothetical protein